MTPVDKEIKKQGLKKLWIAEKVGISRNTLSRIAKGETNPTLEVALKLSIVLGKSVEDLWGHLVSEWREEWEKAKK